MPNIYRLNTQLAFAPQLFPEDLPHVAAAGYYNVVCNRPDGEADDQPTFAELKTAADKLGITLVSAPVSHNVFTEATIEKVAQVLAQSQPTLLFCRTGTRSILLRTMIELRNGKDLQTLLSQAAELGYDLQPMLPTLQSYAEAANNQTPRCND